MTKSFRVSIPERKWCNPSSWIKPLWDGFQEWTLFKVKRWLKPPNNGDTFSCTGSKLPFGELKTENSAGVFDVAKRLLRNAWTSTPPPPCASIAPTREQRKRLSSSFTHARRITAIHSQKWQPWFPVFPGKTEP